MRNGIGQATAKGGDPFSGGNALDFSQVLRFLKIIRERALWGILAGLMVAGLYAWFELNKEEVYATEAFLLIEARAEQVIDVEKVVDTSLTGWFDFELENHLRKIKSRKFLQTVLKSFGPAEAELITAPYQDEKEPPALGEVVFQSVNVFREDQLFTVHVRHRDARAAALIANRYFAQYINDSIARSWTGNESAKAFLERQAADLREQISAAERELTEYRSENNLISLEENQNIIVNRLNSISSSRTSVRIQQLQLESAVQQIKATKEAGGDLTEISYIADFGSVQSLLAKRKNLETEIAALNLRYLERHPKLVDATKRLENINAHLDKEVGRAVSDLYNRREEVVLRMENLTNELEKAEAEALALDRQAVEYNVMRRELESSRRTFDAIIARLNETNLSGKLDTTNLRILDEASVPGMPVEPNPKKVGMVAAMLFLVGLAGVPFIFELLDNRLRSSQDVEAFTGKPVLTEIPYLRKLANQRGANVVLDGEENTVSERFRVAYSALNTHSSVGFPKTIMVASTLPSEGKSFIAVNLAACMAKHGLRCLLVDTDFRRPSLHRSFELRNDKGILAWIESIRKDLIHPSDAGAWEVSLKDPDLDIQRIAPGLELLRSGGSTKHTTELFESAAFDRLMGSLKQLYDVILLDTPPVSVFTDNLFLAELADEIIYVARHKKVSKHKVRHFIAKLDGQNYKTIGVVVNGQSPRKKGMDHYADAYKYYEEEKELPDGAAPRPPSREPRSRRSVTPPPFPVDDPPAHS